MSIRISTPLGGNLSTLYVGSLLPLSNYWWAPYGVCYIQFLKRALEEINNSTDILPGYRLELVAGDTQGVAGLGVKRMVEMLESNVPKIALIGIGLSDEMSLIGQVAQYFNTPVLSFAATTSHSLDRDLYKSVYITNYLGESVNPARIAIMKAFHWTHVATLVYKDQVFETQITNFHTYLAVNNFTLVTSGIITDPDQISEHMIRLKQYDARIIMAAFRSNLAPYVFCQAYKHGIYGKSYQWILTGDSMYDGWIGTFFKGQQPLPCSRDEVVTASKNYLVVDNVYLRRDVNTSTISGKTAIEYSTTIEKWAGKLKLSRTHPYGYDAVWALALALNRTQEKLTSGVLNQTVSLSDFNYTRSDLFDLMIQSLQEITFEGVSGTVAFNEYGQRMGPHDIVLFYNDSKTLVGEIKGVDGLNWSVPIDQLFEGRQPPRDRFHYVMMKLPPSDTAVVIVLLINTLGFLVGVGFLVFNILYRNNRHIKMSSPAINNIIVMGCLLMYVFVYVLTSDYANWFSDTNSVICMVRLWLACIGFTLSFGALFSKTWRVHALFRNDQIKRKVIKDLHLFSQVLVLVLVDMVILVPWSTLHALVKTVYRLQVEGQSTGDELVTYTYTGCSHEFEVYWYMAEYIYKGLLLVFGAFLAWETRMVTIPALNDSKLIGFCIYNIAIVCAFVVPVTYVLGQERKTLTFILVAVFVSLCTSLVLCILFIPKVRLRNQVDDRRFVTSLNTQQPAPGYGQGRAEVKKDLLNVPSKSRPSNGNSLVKSRHESSCESVFTGQGQAMAGYVKGQGHAMSSCVEVEEVSSSSVKADGASSGDIYDGGDCRAEGDLRAEVNRLNLMLADEIKAISRLRTSLLRETNQTVNFHKIGHDYVIFKANAQPDVVGTTVENIKESET
ncbi:gamma-aminobutyric acid type B receptor subunit 2-like [Physella acuta]|uniref:gamma-aminobutyric acid type B receptor subunit 2-like n=1 Tax=Physella acuta TaxID=109671 RepID=UPI0027DAF047|nr:gamma-aminobutyric acid type B receptor subunit 2-like [Physella acuta]